MGYQAATVETVPKARRAWQVRKGPRGIKGEASEKGVAGPHGPRGIKGEAGKVAAEQRNWKQCAWQKSDNRDIGLIQVSGRQIQISLFRPSYRNSNKRLSK